MYFVDLNPLCIPINPFTNPTAVIAAVKLSTLPTASDITLTNLPTPLTIIENALDITLPATSMAFETLENTSTFINLSPKAPDSLPIPDIMLPITDNTPGKPFDSIVNTPPNTVPNNLATLNIPVNTFSNIFDLLINSSNDSAALCIAAVTFPTVFIPALGKAFMKACPTCLNIDIRAPYTCSRALPISIIYPRFLAAWIKPPTLLPALTILSDH